MLTLQAPLEHAQAQHGQRTAVIDGERRFTYRELYERCRRLAGCLSSLGLNAGDRVALLAANCHAYLEVFCGAPAAGMVVVPLNFRLAEPELITIVRDCRPRILISDRDPGALATLVERVVMLPDEYETLLQAASPMRLPRLDENDLAALFYTGGTTGLPKGVMLTHRNLVANAFHKTIACTLVQDDVYLAAPAMFHVAGIAPLLGLIWLGATIVMVPSFDPELCLDCVEGHGVTLMMPVPTMVAAMVDAQCARPRNVSSLRMIGHAGSPISNEAIERAHETFKPAEIAQFYGATETSSIVTCFRDEGAAIGSPLLGSCGRPVAGVEVRVERPDGSACEPGEIGEITVRGANVTIGYWNQPEATASALRDGRYHTGDLGRITHEGFLFVVDRLKDMIVSGGENVYSIEVEDVLCQHTAVREAAVFGVPDDRWGEAVHAVVVVAPERAPEHTALEAMLKHHCRSAIAGYKVPKRIEARTEPLPKSGPGKVLKRALRKQYLRQHMETATEET
ncbi:MAG: AMP-binding protein [Myxococcales bacterium]|nr:AMP-binding protein [Myxococcales bacterium]